MWFHGSAIFSTLLTSPNAFNGGSYFWNPLRLGILLLYAFIAMISMVGVYASSFSIFQMWMALAIGVLAFLLRAFGYPVVPALMGVILGPYFEEFLRRSLIVSDGDPTIFLRSPASVILLVLTGLFVWLLRIRPARRARRFADAPVRRPDTSCSPSAPTPPPAAMRGS